MNCIADYLKMSGLRPSNFTLNFIDYEENPAKLLHIQPQKKDLYSGT